MKKKLFILLLSVAVVLSMSAIGASAVFADTTTNVSITASENFDYANQVLTLVNKERVKAGVSPLTMDSDLESTAMYRAMENVVYWSHTRPDGTLCFTASSKMFGENIAAWQTSPTDVMNSWMNSAGHKANILSSSFTSIGIGCVKYEGNYYWVQCFGSDAGDSPSVSGTKTVTESIKTVTSNISLLYPNNAGSVSITNTNGIAPVIGSANAGWSYAYFIVNSDALTYSSSDSSVFTVDASGKVIPVGLGTAKYTATLKDDPSKTVSHSIKVTLSKPSKVVLTKATALSGHKAKVTWKKRSCSGYQVRYSKHSSFSKYSTVTVNDKATTSTVISKLTKGKKYYVKVRAYNSYNGQTVYGTFSNVKYFRAK